MLALQQNYVDAEQMVQSIIEEKKGIEPALLIRCYFLLIELFFTRYRLLGESKEVNDYLGADL